jgi:DNA replication protein DnaC
MSEVTTAQILDLAAKTMMTKHVVASMCENATLSDKTFLYTLLEAELASRHRSKITRLTKQAGFPALKTMDSFHWSHTTLPASLTREDLTSASFARRIENLVLTGPVGTGKTHLASAIGLAACQQGMRVKFTTVAHLVLSLTKAAHQGSLDREMALLAKLDVLILDELGYIPIDLDQARLLFQVIADAYETTSLIITTNLEFARWGEILADTQMAAALIERVVHHGHHITFEGSSWRLENSLMRQGGNTTTPAN